MSIGQMRQRLILQTCNPVPVSVRTLTRSGAVATVTTADAHGYATGDYVTIAGATPTGYNAKVKITVTGATTFTFAVSSGLATPATGTITVVYVSDAQAGRRIGWTTVATVWGELMPLRTSERLQAAAVQAQVDYQFKVRVRNDVTATMRVLWTPTWPAGASQKILVLTGAPLPFEDERSAMLLEVSERAA